MPSHTISERRKRRKGAGKTKEQKKVSDTARRRVEKLHAEDKWDRMMGGPTASYNAEEREMESRRRGARMDARRRARRAATRRQR